ncbi:MAG: 3-oxoacyl-ACP reductase [Gammaproteobacteria bacterium]|nr:3-oxoacyl-ACP reductase [Gammaproteobacteria bacterium]|tara:strand:+ start:8939 stop:9715 length:777 start_codon:yes stop_codon:yes gene_type:complete
MQLEGRVAAITGGTAGIGLGIAEVFLDAGARVALMARNEARGREVASRLGSEDRVLFVAGDATVQRDVEGFVDAAAGGLGAVDILVNNAGGASDLQPLVQVTDEEWDHVLKWNLYSTFWATRRALPGMVERGWGRVINVSSVEGKHGKPVFTAYTAAKHAINGLTKSVAREVGAAGVTVNAICPGLVITDIIRRNGPATAQAMGMTFDEMVDAFAKDSALERPVTVEEVAALALLLASDVGGGITGALLSVDGGTAQY